MCLLLTVKDIENYLEKEKVASYLDVHRPVTLRTILYYRSSGELLIRISELLIRISELLSIRPPDLEPHNQVVSVIKAKGSKHDASRWIRRHLLCSRGVL